MNSTGDTHVAGSAEDPNTKNAQVHSTNLDHGDATVETVDEFGEHGTISGDEHDAGSGDENEPSDDEDVSHEEEEDDSGMEENAKFNDNKIHFIDLQVKKLQTSKSKPR